MNHRASVQNSSTRPCVLRFSNRYHEPVSVLWLDWDGNEKEYAVIQPYALHGQSTYTTHPWRLKAQHSGRILGEYVGPDATILVQPDGQTDITQGHDKAKLYNSVCRDTQWGRYCLRSEMRGIQIWAFECVSEFAVQQAAKTLYYMLYHTPQAIIDRLVSHGAELAIIGCQQVTSDLPPHSDLKGADAHLGDRTIDGGTRGLGGSVAVPTASVGEENITMIDDSFYSCESILLHEFAHSVLTLGMSEQQAQRAQQAHDAAKASGVYDVKCYMMENVDEYWAEGTQSWFDATVRTDVNTGVNTRELVKQKDPLLAALMTEVYGDGPWRYGNTSAAPFGNTPRWPAETAPAQPILGTPAPQQMYPPMPSVNGGAPEAYPPVYANQGPPQGPWGPAQGPYVQQNGYPPVNGVRGTDGQPARGKIKKKRMLFSCLK